MTYRPIVNYGGATYYGKDENGNSLSFVTEADFVFSRGSTSYSWDYSIEALRDFIAHKNTITQLYHTYETVNNYTASGGAVTIADTQTITGIKTFTNNTSFSGKVTLSGGFENCGHIVIPNNSIQYNVVPISDCNNYIIHRSKEGNDLSYIQLAQLSDGKAKAQFSASTYASNGTRYTASIYATVDRSGNASTYAPTPTDGTSTTSNQIATVGWINSIGNSVVHLTGSETITGTKTFSTAEALRAKNPVLLKENSANEGGQINFQRADNSVLTSDPYIDLLTNTIRVVGVDSSNNTNIPLQVDIQNNTVTVTTPVSATDNSTKVATTAWVNNRLSAMNEVKVIVSSYANGTNWYRVWSDGWIEQGGHFLTGNTWTTVNLLKAFSSTNYSIFMTCYWSQGASATCTIYSASGAKTTTSFQAYFYVGGYSDWYACGY